MPRLTTAQRRPLRQACTVQKRLRAAITSKASNPSRSEIVSNGVSAESAFTALSRVTFSL